jgi:AraC family transcriptional regulator
MFSVKLEEPTTMLLVRRAMNSRRSASSNAAKRPYHCGFPEHPMGMETASIRRSEWLGTNMNQGFARKQALVAIRPTAKRELTPVDVAEVPAPRGEFILPAVNQVRLALALSDFSASWRGSRGLLSKTVSAGMTTICEFNQARRLEMRNSTSYAIVLLRNEILEQALHDSRQPRVELQKRYHLQDETLRHLIEVLLHEKRQGFQSGAFFLDGVTVALASYLIRHYSADAPVRANSVGGMAPSILRRCIALMEARLEGDLRLDELAGEAGLSTSHFIRSFRESTGKTPYQFLLERRVQRAQTLMRDPRASLAEIARSTGFADQHHLARAFRRITGITPSTYRRSL